MATKYQDSPKARTIAQDLIEEYHADLGHLEGQCLVYCWRNKAQGVAEECRDSLGTEDWSEGPDFAFFVVEIAARR